MGLTFMSKLCIQYMVVLLIGRQSDVIAKGFSDFNLMFVMNFRYNEWLNAISCVWMAEDAQGMFRGSSPASDPTFMVVEFV